MVEQIIFFLDGKFVVVVEGEMIWQVVKCEGIVIFYFCYKDVFGYWLDGNCCVCMVDIEGECILVVFCI